MTGLMAAIAAERLGSGFRWLLASSWISDTGDCILIVGGVLADHFGIAAPFWFAFIGSAVFVVLIWAQLTHIARDEPHPVPETAAIT